MRIDNEFIRHFGSLKQVFMYLIDECNLCCEYCLYKPNLHFQLSKKEIPYRTSLSLLKAMKDLGAIKLTLMGGEPTLYGCKDGKCQLPNLISFAKKIGYEYIRIDTNGIFSNKLLDNPGFRLLDEITFSIDGYNSATNDPYRGYGSFEKAVNMLKKCIENGYNVDVTACVHRTNAKMETDGNYAIEKAITFFAELGVKRVNLHPILLMNIPRDTWIGDTWITPKEWIDICNVIRRKNEKDEYNIPVRIPDRFVNKSTFYNNPEFYGYCSSKMGERVLIHPNGIIRVCALLIGTPYGVARYDDNNIYWDHSTTNEIKATYINESCPCMNQSIDHPNIVPLCISFKAGQDEYVWNKVLQWENKRSI